MHATACFRHNYISLFKMEDILTNQWTLNCPKFKCVVLLRSFHGIHVLIQSTRVALDNTF